MKKVKITSLGCAKNLVDAEVMAGLLEKSGFLITHQDEDADILLVNTCGFIEEAREESVSEILQAVRHKENGGPKSVIVTGCLAQRFGTEILDEIPEIDALIGTGEVPFIAEVVQDALQGKKPSRVGAPSFIYNHEMPRKLFTPTYSAYVKVAEGCSNRCTYCAIPQIRGEFRSRRLESVENEVSRLFSGGVKEINLIAQDTTRYGLDLYGEFKLAELLARISTLDPSVWIRILYTYPTHFTAELIETIATADSICKYLDIPLQHADDRILQAMNRRASRQQVIQLIQTLRRKIPDLTLRTTFIVGFPGETEACFRTLVSFVKEMEFDRVGVFTFSPEEGTPAAAMPDQVPSEIKEERKDILLEIQQGISLAKNRAKIGKTVDVLIEGPDETAPGIFIGRTQADAPEADGTITLRGKNLRAGSIVKAKITHAYEYDLIGEVWE